MLIAERDVYKRNQMNLPRTLSVVVPTFNSEQTLPILIDRLNAVLTDSCQAFEIILVNDGSSDGSWGTILSLSERFPLAPRYKPHA